MKLTMNKDSDAKQNDFDRLVGQIQSVSEALQQDARMIINCSVTCRAWLTGYYIVEYEQHGNDRAKYGERLLQNLSKQLGEKSFGVSSLKNYRQFYLYYPELKETLSNYLFERFGDNQQKFSPLIAVAKSQSVIGGLYFLDERK